MKAWRALILLLLALTSTAFAGPVLIYRGTGRQVGQNDAVVAGPVSVYVLVDTSTRQVATITYYIRNKQKRQFGLSPSIYRRVTFTLDSGKTSNVYSQNQVLEIGDQYALASRTLRGTNTGIRTSTEAVIPLIHPRTLSGIEIIFADTTDSKKSSDLRYTVSLLQQRTIAANDANQSIATVYNALVAELDAKGF